jgi:Tol biopolymer transport system component
MRRSYLFAALILIAGFGLALAGFVTNQVSIPDARMADLGISGRLLVAREQAGVSTYDLASGEVTTLFAAPPRTLIAAATLSPDGATLALAYAPPPDGPIQFGFTNLYILPADGSLPPQLLVDGHNHDVIANPVWSTDGRSVTYVRSGPSADGLTTQLSIERIAFPGGDPQVVVASGFSPDLSADGERIAYVAVPQGSSADSLFVAEADGGHPIRLAASDRFLSIDRPRFSPDGEFLAFSGDPAPFTASSPARELDWTALMGGVRVASAHTVPTSDIWRVPLSGGEPTKLIKLLAQGIAFDYSPDGRRIVFITTQGLYLMNGDGSQPVRISDLSDFKSVEWLAD